ncbi:hypothetical protein IC744_16185 [Microbacterium hominis]|uniref:hypothetical protein n=1 Tax=Microbacterium TaxID=33882 RepID=UPI00168AB9F0|nr:MULTISPECIES: hypothetical protein [Microbacterium]QOC24800.1 hypothetical protein IC745_10430 [Microbacterium hominis]QOC28854.1 hypothetical protein IC744_16185 [Microbacterium hominis]QYF98945.1 hypothetical protein KY498_06945 [Microbacterium sp. PAMC21962]
MSSSIDPEEANIETPPVPDQSAAEAASTTAPLSDESRTPRKLWPPSLLVGAIGAGVLGLILGATAVAIPAQIAASGSAAQLASSTETRDTLEIDLKNAKSSLRTSESQLSTAEASLEELQGRVSDLEAREAAVTEREAAVKTTEQTIAANSFGEGIRLVGKNTAAGVYTTAEITSGSCYYVWRTSTASDAEIIDNNIVKSGTATVTLRDGDVFESSRCGKWTKTG